LLHEFSDLDCQNIKSASCIQFRLHEAKNNKKCALDIFLSRNEINLQNVVVCEFFNLELMERNIKKRTLILQATLKINYYGTAKGAIKKSVF